MKTRRQFLQSAATAALLVPIASIGAVTSFKPLSYAHFASLVGTEFIAFNDDGKAVKLLLDSVDAKALGATYELFALRFRSKTETLGQGTYRFKHRRILGSFSIFIVPNAGGEGENVYEAVFNRLIG